MSSSDGHVKKWSELKLGNALPISYGKALRSDARDSSGSFSVFGSAGKIGLHSSALTSGPTLVIGRKGSAGAVHYSPDPCWVIDTAYFSEATDRLDLKFAYYLLQHSRLGTLDRSTAVPSLGRDDYNAVSICIPDKPEQEHIVDKIEELFSDLEAGVTALERTRAKLKRYRASVLKAAVEGRLTEKWRAEQNAKSVVIEPAAKLLEHVLAKRRKKWEAAQLKKFVDSGKPAPKGWEKKYPVPRSVDSASQVALPESWCWAHIEQLIEPEKHALKAGPFGSALKKSSYVPAGFKIYGQEQVIRGDPYFGDYFISEEKYNELENCKIKPGDLLISLVGTIGKTLVLPEDALPGIINPRLIKMSLNSHVVLPQFVQIYLQSPPVKAAFKLDSHGGTMEILNMGILSSLAYPLPPLSEQAEVVNQVEAALSTITHAEAEIEHSLARAARLRQTILKRAFEGRLV